MKTKTYKTISGKMVTAIRPETELESRIIETEIRDKSSRFDARHSLGDDAKSVEVKEETITT